LKKLHIVSFINPYPPDYGGVIDVYFKIKALHKAGIAVILHIFEYNRPPSPELNALCERVFYYPRKTGWVSQFTLLPYIVSSRKSDELLSNLAKDDFPILFEGLHCCFYLNHPILKHKQKLVRMHNIEHEYYAFLSKSKTTFRNRFYYRVESFRLARYEKVLKFADTILSISISDAAYFERKYGKTTHIGAFHVNERVSCKEGKGDFILMHGNLEVEENESAVLHCIENVFAHIDFPVFIAGKNPSNRLKREINLRENITLTENPNEAEMDKLQHDAHIHLCYTFQASGLKLKLLNSLFKGRYVVANPQMTEGSGLEELTETGRSDAEIIQIINRLLTCEMNSEEIQKREKLLRNYSNSENAAKIAGIIRS